MNFYRITHATIMSGKVVRYRSMYGAFEINASRSGVMITGDSAILDEEDIADVLELIQRANVVATHINQNRQYRSEDLYPEAFHFRHDPACVVELREAHFGAEDTVIEQRERTAMTAPAPSTRSQEAQS